MSTSGPPPQERGASHDAWLTPGRLASLVAVLAAAYAVLVVLRALRPLLLMLLVSLFLSFAMEPAVQFLSRRGWRRGAATGAVFIIVAAAVLGFFAAMAPLFVDQVTDLVRNVPQIVDRLGEVVADAPLPFDFETSEDARGELLALTNQFRERLEGAAFGAAGRVVDVGATAFGALLQALTILLVTFYLVADGPRARRVMFRPFPPDRQREMLAVWELAVAKTGGYIYSRLLLAFISAVATGLFLVVLGVPFAIPLAAWVGVTSAFVPVFGTYLGGILPVIVAVASAVPETAIWVVVFLVIYQQIENYLLAPRIQGHTMEVHPAVAFVSVLAGGYLLGAVGALLALPAAAIIQAVLSTYVSRHDLIRELREMEISAEADPAASAGDRPRTPGQATLQRLKEIRDHRRHDQKRRRTPSTASPGTDDTSSTEEHV